MDIENITTIVLMPAVMREIWKHPETIEDSEAFLEVCTAYKTDLDKYVFAQERNNGFYESFKDMLSRYSLIFQKDYPMIESLDNKQIDQVLEKVRKARETYTAAAENCLKR